MLFFFKLRGLRVLLSAPPFLVTPDNCLLLVSIRSTFSPSPFSN